MGMVKASAGRSGLSGGVYIALLVAVVAAIGTAFIFTLITDITGPEKIKIGVVTPLTGPAASYGYEVLSGATIAQQVINENGGIDGAMVELVAGDGECDGDASSSRATEMVRNDGVIGVVGVVCSSAALSVAELAQSEDFILIAAAASHPDVTDGENVFRVNPNDLSQAYGLSTHAKYNMGFDKISILAVENEYGRGLVEEFSGAYAKTGGTVERVVWFGDVETDFGGHVENLGDPGLLLIIAHPSQHPQIADDLVAAGNSATRIADFNFGLVPGGSPNGATRGTIHPVMIFNPDATQNARILKSRMQEAYEREPSIVAAWGFDSFYAMARAAQVCDSITTKCLREKLAEADYQGASGRIKFRENGDIESTIFQFVESE